MFLAALICLITASVTPPPRTHTHTHIHTHTPNGVPFNFSSRVLQSNKQVSYIHLYRDFILSDPYLWSLTTVIPFRRESEFHAANFNVNVMFLLTMFNASAGKFWFSALKLILSFYLPHLKTFVKTVPFCSQTRVTSNKHVVHFASRFF